MRSLIELRCLKEVFNIAWKSWQLKVLLLDQDQARFTEEDSIAADIICSTVLTLGHCPLSNQWHQIFQVERSTHLIVGFEPRTLESTASKEMIMNHQRPSPQQFPAFSTPRHSNATQSRFMTSPVTPLLTATMGLSPVTPNTSTSSSSSSSSGINSSLSSDPGSSPNVPSSKPVSEKSSKDNPPSRTSQYKKVM